jgi:hypothetical protein
VIAEGWDRFRPERGADEVMCAVPAQTEGAARAQVVRVLRVQPADVIDVGLESRAA